VRSASRAPVPTVGTCGGDVSKPLEIKEVAVQEARTEATRTLAAIGEDPSTIGEDPSISLNAIECYARACGDAALLRARWERQGCPTLAGAAPRRRSRTRWSRPSGTPSTRQRSGPHRCGRCLALALGRLHPRPSYTCIVVATVIGRRYLNGRARLRGRRLASSWVCRRFAIDTALRCSPMATLLWPDPWPSARDRSACRRPRRVQSPD
jgi:hypothetical protein